MTTQTGGPLGVRTRALIVAFLLALTFYASAGAQLTLAYEKGVCKHYNTEHRGPEGRLHVMAFRDHYYHDGYHWHKMTHYTKVAGHWETNYTRHYICSPVNA